MPLLAHPVSMASVTRNLIDVYTMQSNQIYPHCPLLQQYQLSPKMFHSQFPVLVVLFLFYNPLSPLRVALVCIPVCMGQGREGAQDIP